MQESVGHTHGLVNKGGSQHAHGPFLGCPRFSSQAQYGLCNLPTGAAPGPSFHASKRGTLSSGRRRGYLVRVQARCISSRRHVKEYIAYYNWTFGGQCGLGAYGNNSPPPYMADQYGYPVVDIYVDAVPPFNPRPYVAAITPSSVAFTWDPVADRGDGAGRDYFVSGLDHYVSWLTVGDRPGRLQLATTPLPRSVSLPGMPAHEIACLHVQAVDRVQNATADQVSCAAPLGSPPMPAWPEPESAVTANPTALGLVGLPTWFWLAPTPSALSVGQTSGVTQYVITATPIGVDWDFGDGRLAQSTDSSGFGRPYPQPSPVTHVYEAHSQDGYAVQATIRYDISWTAMVGGNSFGPYPLGRIELAAHPLVYPVEQAQPELIET